MRIKFGSNRVVILTKKFAYKLPLFFRGRRANKNEYENFIKRRPYVADTEKHWYGLKQERLHNCVVYPLHAKKEELRPEHQHLYKLRIIGRIQIGQDKHDCWKFYDYEEVKYLEDKDKSKYDDIVKK